MRRLLPVVALSAVALASCNESPVDPGGQGGISLNVHVIRVIRSDPGASATTGAAASAAGPAQVDAIVLDSTRVVLSGAASRTVSATPGSDVTISDLPIGTYTAVLEGWSGDEIVYHGEVTGIQVTGGNNTTVADVLYAPTDLEFIAIGETVQLQSPSGTSWMSSDGGVVDAGTGGLLTAVTNGSSEITGSLGSSSVTIATRVAQEVASVTVAPATATIDPGTTQQFTATALDPGGTEITGVDVLWVSSDHNVATVDQTGLATGVGEGTVTISAAVRGEPGNADLTVNAVVATHLVFTTEPSSPWRVNQAFSPALQVEIRDANDNLVTSARDLVTIAIGTNPKSGKLVGSTSVAAVGGIATFTGLAVDKGGVGYTLDASSGSLTGASTAAFDVGRVALLANTTYVDYIPGNLGSEASNVEAGYESFGNAGVRPFTDISAAGITAAVDGADILAIPEQENGILSPDLTTAASTAISDFVNAGGTLVVFYSYYAADLLNSVFSYALGTGTSAATYNLVPGVTAGTPFAGAPATLTGPSATATLAVGSLPSGTVSVYTYTTTGDPVVAVIPVGSGRIVVMGWDWFDAVPVGSTDDNWIEVLRRTTLY